MVSALLAATVVLGVAGIHITSTVAPQIFCSRAGRERVGAGIIVLFCSGFYIYASVSRMVTANLVLLLSAVLGVLFFLEILLRMTIRICYRGAA